MEKKNLYKITIENEINNSTHSKAFVIKSTNVSVPKFTEESALKLEGIDLDTETAKAIEIRNSYVDYFNELSSNEKDRLPSGRYKISLEIKLEKLE